MPNSQLKMLLETIFRNEWKLLWRVNLIQMETLTLKHFLDNQGPLLIENERVQFEIMD